MTTIMYNVKSTFSRNDAFSKLGAAREMEMRVSRAEAAKNRERIIEVASKLFRERGFEGIGVADLMKSCGLTHGGFYGHFSSKEDLIAQACAKAMKDSISNLEQRAGTSGENALVAIAAAYLSVQHRDDPGAGCVMAALGAEAARHGSQVRGSYTQGVRTAIELLMKHVPGSSEEEKRERALAIYASLVGAIVLARAVDDPDLSESVLKSVLKQIANANR